MNVNLYVKPSTQNYSATALNANAAQYEQKNNETSSARNKDSVEISQSGRLASAFDIDEDTANRIEEAVQNADIPALLKEFKEKQGSLPVDEEWHYRKIVDPDGKIYSLTYAESLLRQYQCAENTIKEYYAKAHQDNLSQGSITDSMNYLSMKYTEFGLRMGSPYYRADMSEAERKMALYQEKALLLGGRVTLGDPYALASSGGTINIKDADRIAHQAARDRIDELISEYKRANGIV
ncbi:MAG: hypothetical protein HFH32_18990 [Eubacterium sp.]|jgi:hypothetical protein|nr:hypothetical protein [Eubacterium sp.]